MSDLSLLPKDVLFTIALELNLPDLLKLCQTNSRINNLVCKQKNIWIAKLLREFPDVPIVGDPRSHYVKLVNNIGEVYLQKGKYHRFRVPGNKQPANTKVLIFVYEVSYHELHSEEGEHCEGQRVVYNFEKLQEAKQLMANDLINCFNIVVRYCRSEKDCLAYYSEDDVFVWGEEVQDVRRIPDNVFINMLREAVLSLKVGDDFEYDVNDEFFVRASLTELTL